MTGGGAIGVWFALAVALSLGGYALYLAGLSRRLVRPNRASWLIWSAATGIETITYAAVNPGAPQTWIFAGATFACVAVTVAMWRQSRWRTPDRGETFCIAASLAAILVWVAFSEAFWAHMLVVAAIPVSFWPTWTGVWEDRTRERSPAWGLWTLGDLAALIVTTRSGATGIGDYAYILMELACHASVWFLIGLATVNPWRSLGRRRGPLFLLDAQRPAANLFAVTTGPLGKAVHAAQGFAAGERIVGVGGRRVLASDVRLVMHGVNDRFLQVGPDEFIGPSGGIDDLVNHSCEPNAGLRFGEDGVALIAIRDIAAGEEIAWDYSTTLQGTRWPMVCACGSARCRGTIGDFADLPPEQQSWYRARNLVAPYLLQRPAQAEERAA